MEEVKKGFLPMSHGIHLSKSQCPTTTDERDRMSKVPYASVIGSIMYAMISTCPTPGFGGALPVKRGPTRAVTPVKWEVYTSHAPVQIWIGDDTTSPSQGSRDGSFPRGG